MAGYNGFPLSGRVSSTQDSALGHGLLPERMIAQNDEAPTMEH